jgi:hypothetical protein
LDQEDTKETQVLRDSKVLQVIKVIPEHKELKVSLVDQD